jgi:phage repressor protein C with HTH and peptisase S24 domain
MSTNAVLLKPEPLRFIRPMNKVAEIRQRLGWSQQDLAEKLETTAVSVGRYEKEDQRLTLPLMRRLANILNTSVAEIAGEPGRVPEHLAIPVYDIRAAAGAGALAIEETPVNFLMFREQWVRRINRDPKNLSVIEVSGDSMWDTLHDGDHALIDRSQSNPRREGLYVIRIDDVLQIKRISMHPVSRLLTIKSDNPAYPTYSDVSPDDIAVVGRVVWIGRSLG